MTKRSEPGGGTPEEVPAPFAIADASLPPGTRRRVEVALPRLTAGGELSLPIHVVHGGRPGPVMLLSGAIHGDELDGMEIIRRVLGRLDAESMAGTVVAVPIVNVFGVITESRYLPDRRDLNRSFPGSARGSLAARLAHLFMREVVRHCDHGIDFHCGSDDRENLPHVRCNLDDPDTRRLARAFGAPVILHGTPPGGSLRRAAVGAGTRMILYEAGEAKRFTTSAIDTGVAGTLSVLAELGMRNPGSASTAPARKTLECRDSRWLRAGRSGICRLEVELGERVRDRQTLGAITDALGRERHPLRARGSGIVIGRRINPLVYQGEALVHLAAC